MAWPDAVRLAVGTLTVLPAGPVRQLDRSVARTAMIIAPLAVVPLAVAAAAAGWVVHVLGWPSLLCGLVTVSVLALGTRALHLDGLADTVDGLGSGWDRDRALAVMRRGDVGPMGVVTLIVTLGIQTVAVGSMMSSWQGAVQLAVLVCCSRAALALVCGQGVPPARSDGLGAAVAGSVPRWAAAASWAVVIALLVVLAVWLGHPWWSGLVSAGVAVLGVLLVVRRCVRRFGGVTGDVMGAVVEVAFTLLVVLAAR